MLLAPGSAPRADPRADPRFDPRARFFAFAFRGPPAPRSLPALCLSPDDAPEAPDAPEARASSSCAPGCLEEELASCVGRGSVPPLVLCNTVSGSPCPLSLAAAGDSPAAHGGARPSLSSPGQAPPVAGATVTRAASGRCVSALTLAPTSASASASPLGACSRRMSIWTSLSVTTAVTRTAAGAAATAATVDCAKPLAIDWMRDETVSTASPSTGACVAFAGSLSLGASGLKASLGCFRSRAFASSSLRFRPATIASAREARGAAVRVVSYFNMSELRVAHRPMDTARWQRPGFCRVSASALTL